MFCQNMNCYLIQTIEFINYKIIYTYGHSTMRILFVPAMKIHQLLGPVVTRCLLYHVLYVFSSDGSYVLMSNFIQMVIVFTASLF